MDFGRKLRDSKYILPSVICYRRFYLFFSRNQKWADVCGQTEGIRPSFILTVSTMAKTNKQAPVMYEQGVPGWSGIDSELNMANSVNFVLQLISIELRNRKSFPIYLLNQTMNYCVCL